MKIQFYLECRIPYNLHVAVLINITGGYYVKNEFFGEFIAISW